MQKKDLKFGMMVQTNNGFLYLVLRDTGMKISDITDNDVLIAISSSGKIYKGWMSLSSYNDDLEHADKDYSIAEIFSTNCAANIGNIKHYKTIWKRKLNSLLKEWIPSGEPPESGKYVLLSFENFSTPLVGRYEENEEGDGAFYVGDDEESCISQDIIVNAWMPLPELFKN